MSDDTIWVPIADFTQDEPGSPLISLRWISAGKLEVQTGRVVACDPMFLGDASFILAREVPVGAYPVVLALVTHPESDGPRVAFALLSIGKKAAVRWEAAEFAGRERASTTDPDSEPGYGVDSACGCFADAACEEYAKSNPSYCDLWQNAWGEEVKSDQPFHTMRLGDDLSLIFFQSGMGDGGYVSFWGFDEDGAVTCLITDFEIVSWPPLRGGSV